MKTSREKAFSALKGITIEKVKAKSVNQLILTSNNGRKFTIDVEVENGIPVMHLTEAFSFHEKVSVVTEKNHFEYD